jgi:hypothetical protein
MLGREFQGQLKARDTNVVNAILTFYEHLVDRGAMSHIVRALGKEEQVGGHITLIAAIE